LNDNTRMNARTRKWMLGMGLLLTLAAARASELIYTPVNPSFGGNPLNGSVLLSTAQAQNKTTDPATKSTQQSSGNSALDQFNDMLERAVLNRLASAAVGGVVSSKGELIPGTVQTSNFTIEIIDLGGGMVRMVTTDTLTGDSTSIDLMQPVSP